MPQEMKGKRLRKYWAGEIVYESIMGILYLSLFFRQAVQQFFFFRNL